MSRPRKVRRATLARIITGMLELATAKEKHRVYSADHNEELDAEDTAAQERFRVEINHRVDALLNLADD